MKGLLTYWTTCIQRATDDLNVFSRAATPVEKIRNTPVSGDALKLRGWKDYLK